MELTQEIIQILLSCKDTQYITANAESLNSYFSNPSNLSLLKFSLTTNKNFSALKIIEKLKLKIIPFIYINPFTYVSLYWLVKMMVLEESEFKEISRKFQVLKDYEILFAETEKTFLSLQIKKKRRIFNRNFIDFPQELQFQNCNEMTFVFHLDDLFDLEKLIEPFLEIKREVFQTDLKTYTELANDPERIYKQSKFKELKGRLLHCTTRNFTSFFSLDSETQRKLESLMGGVSRVRRCGFRYFLSSRKPLSSVMTFCYVFVNSIDLTKIVQIETGNELNSVIVGRRVGFGGGELKYEFLDEMVEKLNRYMRE